MTNDEIKINCDLGEGANNDHLVMPYIDYANISCGAHAGNEAIIRNTLQLAKKYNLTVGAHPGYPDPENFGRISLNLSDKVLRTEFLEQCLFFKRLADEEQVSVSYIKPHGALYNDMAANVDLFTSVVDLLSKTPELPQTLMTLVKSDYLPYQKIAEDRGVKLLWEGFLDRAYEADGSLRSRKLDGALHTNTEAIINQYQFAKQKKIPIYQTNEFFLLPVLDTLCLHSDNESSVKAAQFLRGKND